MASAVATLSIALDGATEDSGGTSSSSSEPASCATHMNDSMYAVDAAHILVILKQTNAEA